MSEPATTSAAASGSQHHHHHHKRPSEDEAAAANSKKSKIDAKGEKETEEEEGREETRKVAAVTEEERDFAWFRGFFLTRHMHAKHPGLFEKVMDPTRAKPMVKDEYDAYVAEVKADHEAWKARNAKVVARRAQLAAKAKATGAPLPAEDQEEREPPSVPLSPVAWLFWAKPVRRFMCNCAEVGDLQELWSMGTLDAISDAFPAFTGNGPLDTAEDRVVGLLREQAEALADKPPHPDIVPIFMLLGCGIVTKQSAAWLDDEDLDRIARVHGSSKATTRATKLRDIFIEQLKMCREFVDRGIPDPATSRTSDRILRAILENSRKALGIRTLVDERPDPDDRAPVPVVALTESGYASIKCAQCDADAVVLADAKKDKERVLQRFCAPCWNLPVGWRALLTAADD